MFTSDHEDHPKLSQRKRIGIGMVSLGLPLTIGSLVWYQSWQPPLSDNPWADLGHPHLGEIYVLFGAGLFSFIVGTILWIHSAWKLHRCSITDRVR